PGRHEGQGQGDHAAGQHDDVQDVAVLEVEGEDLDQDGYVDRIDEQEQAGPDLPGEQPEENSSQAGRDRVLPGTHPRVQLRIGAGFDPGLPLGEQVDPLAHHQSDGGPEQGDEQPAHSACGLYSSPRLLEAVLVEQLDELIVGRGVVVV